MKAEKELINAPPSNTVLVIKFGKPVLHISFTQLKILTATASLLLLANIIISFSLFVSAVKIRNHIGYFIDLISKGEGNVLPSLQALPVLLFVIIDFAFAFLLYKVFSKNKSLWTNRIFFTMIMVSLILILLILIILIAVLTHAHGAHESLHNGIVDSMKNYSSNSLIKSQIDRLQIELQCCGSKKYDEWYEIEWYDTSLIKKGVNLDKSEGHTPFSCCSMSSMFPCIHHNIENTGKVYQYTPEVNLSISLDGCYDILRKRKKKVGWRIVGNLFLYIFMQGLLIIFLRFIQTAHFEKSKFDGHSREYIIWLFGCYTGKMKTAADAPELPPIPPELME